MKIAYFTTEFPGQTHIFLWREYNELCKLGVDVKLVSTRVAPEGIKSHSWTAEAEAKTDYLMPLSIMDILSGIFKLILSPLHLKKRIFKVFSDAEDLNVPNKIVLFAALLIAIKFARLAKAHDLKHIHCTTCGSAANIAIFVSMISDVSYSLSLLGPRLETYGPNQKNKWRYATFGLFQSMQLLKDASQKLSGYLPEKYAFAPVGVNIDFMKRDIPYTPWSGEGICRLYSCGRLNPIKGHEYVIQAIKLLRKRGYNIVLNIGGEDINGGNGYRKSVETTIVDAQLEEYVTLLGAVSEEQNRKQYSMAHIYVMGSLDEAAGAVAAMEAMAMELPVVMPDVGATAELIENGVEGILVKSKSAIELANAIELLLKDSKLAVDLGEKGRLKVVSQFNHRISANQIRDFLEEEATLTPKTLAH